MAENLIITEGDKEQQYQTLFPQIEALLAGETDMTANMANVAAALKQTFDFFWVGFYVVKEDMLVLAPFQGPIACTRIRHGKGVCGTAWKEAKTLIVPDVAVSRAYSLQCSFQVRDCGSGDPRGESHSGSRYRQR